MDNYGGFRSSGSHYGGNESQSRGDEGQDGCQPSQDRGQSRKDEDPPKKTEATIKIDQEGMRAEIKTG
jgi:hypothetical protein